MNKKKNIVLFLLFLVLLVLGLGKIRDVRLNSTVKKAPQEEFLQLLAPYAQDIGEKHGLYPSVILAQAALESSWGKSKLTQEYNNYFGIKGTKDNGVSLETEEIYGGDRVKIKDYFRTYSGARESFQDYGNLIGGLDRYKIVREAQSKEEYAQNLYKAGYSTNPKYGDALLEIVNQYHLEAYDQ